MANKKPIAVIDAETDPFKKQRIPKPFIWGFYDGSEYYQTTDTDELIDFLQDREIIAYAHNGGKFDFHFFLHRLHEFDAIKVISGRLAQFKIGVCEFRDSYNILPVPLAAYEKEKFDYRLMEASRRYKPENWRKIEQYLKSDCLNQYAMVTQFIEQYGLHLTQASASMAAWKQLADVEPPRSDSEYYNYFSPFYYGGRVQCFEIGDIKDDFKMIDIRSAYPYGMLHQHPIGLEYYRKKGKPCATRPEKLGPMFLTIECVSKGAFPYREKNKLTFPADDCPRVYHVTGWEYMAALDTGTITDINIIEHIGHYEHTDFKDYIYHFYQLRQEAKRKNDKANDLFAKLLMNSLYGKFGANPQEYSNVMIVAPENAGALAHDDEGYREAGFLGPWVLAKKPLDEFEQRFYNVATAASITGFVRAYLFRAISQCDGVLYCDTDSIACRDFHDVEIGQELGQWELEGEFNRAYIGGKKLYAFRRRGRLAKGVPRWKIASKGVKLNEKDLREIVHGGRVTYTPEAPTFSLYKAPHFIERRVKMQEM